uniref:Uncharacterized protein n=1 Tax=Francisella tularensis subsp. novicida PA10-7858 TaxID=1386968 RepID=V5T993_FRANO|nr:AAA family ATPase [Francisella tularensis]AHB60787.1 hypothetical protein N894_0019 [Francisella tularensis subsp. novicida PA10-7858]
MEMLELANKLAAMKSIDIHLKNIDKIGDCHNLFQDQKVALKHIAHTRNLNCLVGYNGNYKFSMIKAINDLYKEQNIKVFVAAKSVKVAHSIESNTNVKTTTIDNLVNLYNSGLLTHLPQEKSVLVVVESDILGKRDMNHILKISIERKLKLVLFGKYKELVKKIYQGG